MQQQLQYKQIKLENTGCSEKVDLLRRLHSEVPQRVVSRFCVNKKGKTFTFILCLDC